MIHEAVKPGGYSALKEVPCVKGLRLLTYMKLQLLQPQSPLKEVPCVKGLRPNFSTKVYSIYNYTLKEVPCVKGLRPANGVAELAGDGKVPL